MRQCDFKRLYRNGNFIYIILLLLKYVFDVFIYIYLLGCAENYLDKSGNIHTSIFWL